MWNYNKLEMPLEKADCIWALGSMDTRVAIRAAELWIEGWAPYIVFSGGYGAYTKLINKLPEAVVFAEIAINLGVDRNKIIIEDKSSNTGENVEFTKNLLNNKGLRVNKVILVQKPYNLRRSYTVVKKLWPEIEIITTGQQIDFVDYPNEKMTRDFVINLMVGDTQRIREYPKRGWQIEQEIPNSVWQAFKELVARGYQANLIEEES